MKRLPVLIAILSAVACAQPASDSSHHPPVDCETLLKQIKQMPVKPDWSLCQKGLATDHAHCELIAPSTPEIEWCLVSAITNPALVPDPRAPRMMDTIALGDLAFFVLNDRHPTLWDEVLPPGTDGTPSGYFKFIAEPGMRQELQRKVREALPPNNSFKPKPLRGSA